MEEIEDYVKTALANNDASHDWDHINRVRNLAIRLCELEGGNVELVTIAALLHDVEDSKYQKGGLAFQGKTISILVHDFLKERFDKDKVAKILAIIKAVSFKTEIKGNSMDDAISLGVEIEAKIVQDADRLDAMGAIGIARAFNYAGRIGRPIYSPSIDKYKTVTLVDYRSYTDKTAEEDSTVNHFYEKLFHLKDLMKTKTGRKIAKQRHDFMVDFVQRIKNEWNIDNLEKLVNDSV